MIDNKKQSDHSISSQTFNSISFKSKVTKVAEYWGAETPLASLSVNLLSVEKYSNVTFSDFTVSNLESYY